MFGVCRFGCMFGGVGRVRIVQDSLFARIANPLDDLHGSLCETFAITGSITCSKTLGICTAAQSIRNAYQIRRGLKESPKQSTELSSSTAIRADGNLSAVRDVLRHHRHRRVPISCDAIVCAVSVRNFRIVRVA